ncbi:MAG: glycerol-3-phosphate dehydrogenase [Hyphomicrobiales bacterium]|nr:glycerol-3-phosphate dehydrogenase [Hyphomicrobiales bacterium]
MADFDLAIVGGGINGAGIARDAAGRGLRVVLIEQNDLASGTSSASTKLIHGGLRYLEHGWFRLVREALIEREVMWRMAPHLIRPMRFVLPVTPGMRPAWMLRLGLLLYDHLGGRKLLPATRALDLTCDPLGKPLAPGPQRGFEYSDCRADDARLVVLNAVDAAERGAVVRTRTRCIAAERDGEWRLVLEVRGRRDVVSARILVNATGPWLRHFAAAVLGEEQPAPVRLDKGSHIVVRRLFEHDRGYIFQLWDRRIVFALPFEEHFTLIGTTDEGFDGDPGSVTASTAEVAYLCNAANQYFRTRINPSDVVWSFAGVRALYDDGSGKAQDVSRDYVLTLDGPEGRAPLLTVYGGKITTYRRLAEQALDRLAPHVACGPGWTSGAALPGGELPPDGLDALVASTRRSRPFLAPEHARRLVRSYGTRVARVLGAARSLGDLGPPLGADLTAAEVHYLMEREWALTADDVLWRRSKLGLRFSPSEREALARFMTANIGGLVR